MKDKCKSYENEVIRLKKIHEEETIKLKIRIKNLEKLVRRSDFLISYYHKEFFNLSSTFEESLSSLSKKEYKPIVLNECPPQIGKIKQMLSEEEMLEFMKSRRIFGETLVQIKEMEGYDAEGINSKLNNLTKVFKSDAQSLDKLAVEIKTLSQSQNFNQSEVKGQNTD